MHAEVLCLMTDDVRQQEEVSKFSVNYEEQHLSPELLVNYICTTQVPKTADSFFNAQRESIWVKNFISSGYAMKLIPMYVC